MGKIVQLFMFKDNLYALLDNGSLWMCTVRGEGDRFEWSSVEMTFFHE